MGRRRVGRRRCLGMTMRLVMEGRRTGGGRFARTVFEGGWLGSCWLVAGGFFGGKEVGRFEREDVGLVHGVCGHCIYI